MKVKVTKKVFGGFVKIRYEYLGGRKSEAYGTIAFYRYGYVDGDTYHNPRLVAKERVSVLSINRRFGV